MALLYLPSTPRLTDMQMFPTYLNESDSRRGKPDSCEKFIHHALFMIVAFNPDRALQSKKTFVGDFRCLPTELQNGHTCSSTTAASSTTVN